MKNMEKLCGIIEEELRKISEKGLNTSNIETAYKLVDMYKDLKNTEYWDTKSEYYMAVLDEMQGGYSQNDGHMYGDEYSLRKRDAMGRYSKDGMRGDMGYESGNSYAKRGSMRGRYMRDGGYAHDGYSGYDKYMDSKQAYRSGKSPECKQRLMDTLEEYMDDFSQHMEEMLRDADCAEERTTIKRYLDKIKSIT